MEKLIKVDFRIVGFEGSSDFITEKLKIQPDETWLKGDLVMPTTKSPLRYKVNGWSIISKINNNISLEEHLERLIDILEPKEKQLAELCKKYIAEFACTIYLYPNESVPSMHMSKRILKFAASIGCEIDIDVYDFEWSKS